MIGGRKDIVLNVLRELASVCAGPYSSRAKRAAWEQARRLLRALGVELWNGIDEDAGFLLGREAHRRHGLSCHPDRCLCDFDYKQPLVAAGGGR